MSQNSYESTAEPIKVGYLMDFPAAGLPGGAAGQLHPDLLDLVLEEAQQQGLLDRPVQMIYREVGRSAWGSVKAVIDAYADLVEQGCLVVFGPNITDNRADPGGHRERFKGAGDQCHRHRRLAGEWTFAFRRDP